MEAGMYKPGKESERSRMQSPEEFKSGDECMDHLKSGVSHRETINDKAIEKRAMEKLFGVYP
jgi:hypothetical protein